MRHPRAATPTLAVIGACLCGLGLLAGCGGSTSSQGEPTDVTTAAPHTGAPASDGPRVVRTVASGLVAPWGVAFLPDGSALVTERDTHDVEQVTAAGRVTRVGRVGAASEEGEGGLLGVAVSPGFAQDRQVFFYLTTHDDNRVLRTTFSDGRLAEATPILTGIPRGFIHNGGRLAFGPDGYLYASTGETGDDTLSQDPDSLAGKILRMRTDGSPAPGNPRAGSVVWSRGHRNVQGLAWDGRGRMWASEFGASAYDELNRIVRGGDYGWPDVEGTLGQERPGYRYPDVVWSTDENSPSGLAYAGGHLWMASLQGQRLWRVDVDGAHANAPTDFLVQDYGRMRTVVTTPDGDLWVTTSNRDGRGTPHAGDDKILLVRP